jgi:DNA-binding MarR family transcriptional regulator
VESADFTHIKEKTGATAGNLSVQIDKLEKAKYIKVKKSFKGKRPLTTCSITPIGLEAFEKYVNHLKSYIDK